jgi:hypothetical protein
MADLSAREHSPARCVPLHCMRQPMAKLKREIAEADDRAAAAEAAEAATAEKRFRAVLSRDKRKAAEVQAAAALAATQTHSDAETLGWGVTKHSLTGLCAARPHCMLAVNECMQCLCTRLSGPRHCNRTALVGVLTSVISL